MKLVKSNFCGELLEVLNTEEYPEISIATLDNVKPNKGHYHKVSDEIYWILKGKVEVKLHDPFKNKTWDEKIDEGELLVIRKNIHHKITSSSKENKLCAITHPRWVMEDELESDVIR
jgi:mannose-6-phosphate isomerase-like protein (cupin superfamily)